MQLTRTSDFPVLTPIAPTTDHFHAAAEKFVALDSSLATGTMRADVAMTDLNAAMSDLRKGVNFLEAVGQQDPINGWLNLAFAQRWIEISKGVVDEENALHVRTAIHELMPDIERGSQMLNAAIAVPSDS